MKKIKFFAMALAALAMFSCSKDEVNGGGAGEAEAIGTPTYATFSFKTGAAASAASRAGSIAETDEGKGTADDIASEKVIKTARLLIFSTGPGNLLETNKLVTLTGTGTTKFTEVVKAGDKKMYVIANESATMATALAALTVGTSTKDDFLKLTYEASATDDPSADDKFTLAPLYAKITTAGSEIGFPMSSSDAKTYKFIAKIDQAAAEGGTTEATNSFSIPLDFMLAKVSVVAKNADVLTNATYKISNMKFAIRNIANETFLTQQFDAAGAVKGMYYDFVPTPATSQDGWKPNYHYSAVPSVDVATGAATHFVYAAENTKSTATLFAGGSTYAAISCIITPQSSYSGANMTWDAINNKLALGTAKPIADPTGNVGVAFIVKQQTTGAHASIAAGTVFPTLKDLQIAYFIQTNGRNYVAITDEANLPAIDDADYKSYPAGVAWYRINISKTDAANKPVYGVERGLQYTATINSISGIGLVGDDLAPETPLDQNTYISATISAKGWTAAGSSTDL